MAEYPIYYGLYPSNVIIPVAIPMTTAYTTYESLLSIAGSWATPYIGSLTSFSMIQNSTISYTIAIVNLNGQTVYIPGNVIPNGYTLYGRFQDIGIISATTLAVTVYVLLTALV